MNQSKHKPSRRRLVVIAGTGLLLGLLGIWFCSTVYDPFADTVEDLLVFAPEDADVVLIAPDFPTLVKGLENRTFLTNLEESEGFRRFLSSEHAAGNGILPGIREGYDALGDLERRIRTDAGIELLGDVSGREVVACGRIDDDGRFRFFAAIAPESGMVVMGVNVFLDELLYGWFVESRLEGIEVEHLNWGARVHFTDGSFPDVGVARVADVVLVGTSIEDIAREVRRARTDGIPALRSPRFDTDWSGRMPSGSTVRAIVRRRVFDEHVGIGPRYLVPMWGAGLAGAFERAFPAFDDRDVRFGVSLDHLAQVRASVSYGKRRPADPFSSMEALDFEACREQLRGVLGRFPYHVFGYACFGADPSELFEFALREEGLIDRDERELMFDFLGESVPRFRAVVEPGRPVPDLTRDVAREIRNAFARQMGVVMFRKTRQGGAAPDSTAGYAVVMRVKSAAAVDELIAEIDVAADRPLERYDEGGITRWILANSAGIVDDPDVTRPGFALMGEWFIATNWHPVFEEIDSVQRGLVNSFSTAEIEYAVEELPSGERAFLYVDAGRLYDFMDQAKEGWVRDRSFIDAKMKVDARRPIEIEAVARKLVGEERDVWINQQYQAWIRNKRRELDPARIRAEIDANLDYFRDAFDYLFAGVGDDGDGRFVLDLRLAAHEP